MMPPIIHNPDEPHMQNTPETICRYSMQKQLFNNVQKNMGNDTRTSRTILLKRGPEKKTYFSDVAIYIYIYIINLLVA